jgi:hypothetical protein
MEFMVARFLHLGRMLSCSSGHVPTDVPQDSELRVKLRRRTMQAKQTDTSFLEHIEQLVSEEHRLMQEKSITDEDCKRLSEIKVQLDQCWDLLRQRRALREYGQDESAARLRQSEVVEKYVG